MPGYERLLNLSLRAKLAFVVGVLAVPVLALMGLQFFQQEGTISRTSSEKAGLAYLNEAVFPLLTKIERHRTLAGAAAGGDTTVAADLEVARTDVDAAMATLKAKDRNHGKSWGTDKLVAEAVAAWESARTTSSRASVEQDTKILDEQLLPLVSKVGDASKLFADPDIATRNAIAGIVEHWVAFEEAQTRAAAYTAIVTGTERAFQPAARVEVVRAQQAAAASSEAMFDRLNASFVDNSAYTASLERTLTESTQQTEVSRALITALVNPDGSLSGSAQRAAQESAKLTAANEALYRETSRLVSDDFGARVSAGRAIQFVTLGSSLGALGAAIALAAFVSRSITRPINELAEAADKMSLGELDIEIPTLGDNEVGKLAESLRRMQVSMRGAIERLRARRAA